MKPEIEEKLTALGLLDADICLLEIEKAWTVPTYVVRDIDGLKYWYCAGNGDRVHELPNALESVRHKHRNARLLIICDRSVDGMYCKHGPEKESIAEALRACLSALMLLVHDYYGFQRYLLANPDKIIIVTSYYDELTVHEGMGAKMIAFLKSLAPEEPDEDE